MELRFQCTDCGRKLKANADMAGAAVWCPVCGACVPVPEPCLGPGVTLAGFRIEKELGAGAMGRVFLATQISTKRPVALKVLPSSPAPDSVSLQRFLHEVRLLTQLSHPGIIPALDAGEDYGYHYVAMAYVEGETLDARLKRLGPLPEKDVLTCGVAIAEALAYAWEHGRILHRDIKPANLMVDAQGRALLMDLGVAKTLDDDSHLTAAGFAVGTPNYMSPEQACGNPRLDFRTDIYSLGATLFHLLTGRVPFPGATSMEVISRLLSDPTPSVRTLRPDVSRGCADAILCMMARDRARRYPSWEACIQALKDAMN